MFRAPRERTEASYLPTISFFFNNAILGAGKNQKERRKSRTQLASGETELGYN